MKQPVNTSKPYRAISLLLALCLAAGVFSFGASAASAPGVPANFKAASASYNTVKLTWSAVSNASGYVLYRYSAAAKAYARLAVVNATAYTNTGLVTGVKYYYKVRAYQTVSGKNIYGSPSAAVSAVPVPSVPANFKAASASYNTLNLTWSAVAGASGYVLYRYDAAAKAYARLAVVKTTAYTNTGLTTGASYSYKVRAYRTVSGKNIYGNPGAAASAAPVPGMPADFKANAGAARNIVLTWTAVEGASGYVLYRFNPATDLYDRLGVIKSLSYNNIGLVNANIYIYKIRAYRTVSGKNIYGNVSAALQTIAAPVGGSTADIVEFYNKTANATKAYQQAISISRDFSMTAAVTYVKPLLFYPLVQEMLQPDFDELANNSRLKETQVFNNGVNGETSLSDYLPPSGKETMSTLTPAGVKSASCVASGSSWQISITLIKEQGDASNFTPVHHSTCLNIMPGDTSGDIPMGTQISYDGALIQSTVNKTGYLNSLVIHEPITTLITSTEEDTQMELQVGITMTMYDNFIFTY